MKLLLVAYLHGEGGVQTHTLWLARGLADRGHDVTIATPAPMGRNRPDLPHEPAIRIINIGRLRQVLLGYPGTADRHFDCAVVIGTGWKSMIGPLLNRRIRRRVFFESSSGVSHARLDPRMLVHFGFDAVVGQASAGEVAFRRTFRWTGRSETIPALPHPLERLGDLTRPTPPTPAPGGLRACYCSRLVPEKGAFWLVDHWTTLAKHLQSLDIWGTGPDESRIREAITRKGLGDRIALRGAYRGDLAYVATLQSYDLELLPTFGSEGAPLVLLEAMACGLPFVANGVGGIQDYANPDCRVTNGDLAEFLPALDSLAEALYAGEIDHARLQQHYRDRFSYEAICERWEAFLLGTTDCVPSARFK